MVMGCAHVIGFRFQECRVRAVVAIDVSPGELTGVA
jgi:hypothetical protein